MLVNDAGIGAFLAILQTPEDQLGALWDTDIKGTVLVTQKAAPCCRPAQDGFGAGQIKRRAPMPRVKPTSVMRLSTQSSDVG